MDALPLRQVPLVCAVTALILHLSLRDAIALAAGAMAGGVLGYGIGYVRGRLGRKRS